MSELKSCYVIDRRYLELADDPLLYVVRNATLNNLKPTDVTVKKDSIDGVNFKIRIAKGFDILNIQVECEHGHIDCEAILKTWVNGIYYSSISKKNRHDIYVACLPGFKTAQKFNDNLNRDFSSFDSMNWPEHNTLINAMSSNKKDMVISIQLPLTNSIIKSVLVRSNGNMVAIPVQLVLETRVMKTDEIIWSNECDCIALHGNTIPVVGGNQIGMQQPNQPVTSKETSLIILGFGGKRIACFVDEIIGLQPLILKSLDRFFKNNRGYVAYNFDLVK